MHYRKRFLSFKMCRPKSVWRPGSAQARIAGLEEAALREAGKVGKGQ